MLDETRFESLIGAAPSAGFEFVAPAAERLLRSFGIGLRTKDGSLCEVNLSAMPLRDDVVVLGLRYEKRNGTPTEDHFVMGIDSWQVSSVQPFYKRRLEEVFPEYRGTHKGDFNPPRPWSLSPLLCNTISVCRAY